MNSSGFHRLRRLRRIILGSAAVLLIALAVSVALVQLLLPLIAQHPEWVRRQLSEVLRRPVDFASMQGRWQASGPSFVLRDLRIQSSDGAPPVRLPQAEFHLDFGAWLLPSRHLLNLRARGLQLALSRDADGTWHVNGMDLSGGGGGSGMAAHLSLDVWLDDLGLSIFDARTQRRYVLQAPQVRLSRLGERIRVGASVRRPGVAGELRGVGNFHADGSEGRLYLQGKGLDLRGLLADLDLGGYVVRRGGGDFASWLDWRNAKVVRELVRFDLHDLNIASPSGGQSLVPSLQGVDELVRTREGYRLRWSGDDRSALVADLLQMSEQGPQTIRVAVKDLSLEPLLPWLALLPQIPPGVAQWLGQGRPHGRLDQAQLRWSKAGGLQSVYIAFHDLGIDAIGSTPGIDALRGELRGDGEAVSLSLPGQATVVRSPHTFRKPFALSWLRGETAFWHDPAGWHIGLDTLEFEGEGFGGEANGEVALPADGGRPFLDVYARIDHADIVAAKLFWPLGSMSPAAISWLDRALVDGRIVRADALVRGSLADWPFRHNEGRFEARAELADVTLDYGAGWPRAQDVHAIANFVDNSMQVQADHGQSLGNQADQAVATIADFADTTLDLTVHGSGTGASALDFARNSPIAARQADSLSKLSLGGKVDFGFHLLLPTKPGQSTTLQGQGNLRDADFKAPEWNVQLDKLNGPLRFDGKGFSAGPLQAGFHGQASRLQVDIAGATGDPSKLFSARLEGRYSLAELTQGYSQLDWLKPLADGRADFSVGYEITEPAGTATHSQLLSIDSPLQGISLKLPAPLKKNAANVQPLHVGLPLPLGAGDLQLSIGTLMRGLIRLPDTAGGHPLAASLNFGSRVPTVLPTQGLRIGGHAGLLDASGWVQQSVGGDAGDAGPSLESLDVSADQAQLFGHNYPNLRVRAAPKADTMAFDIDGADIAGNIQVPAVDLRRRGITARLQRLYWPKDEASATAATAPSAPTTSADPASAVGAAARAADIADTAGSASVAAATRPAKPAPAAAAASADAGVAPAALPPLHLAIADLRLGDAKLGEARLETWPTAQGMHIDQLRALSKSVQINASGDWNGDAQATRTHLNMDFAAQNIGDMLSAFGYAGVFSGGKTHARLDASWPGGPQALSLTSIDGSLAIRLTDGRIPEVPPGVGRLFGLVSLGELPRRLTLDFGDVFGKGLAFDAITGDFQFANGTATTDNLKIRGPAADISISGRTGLRSRDYDQQVVVIPHVGNSLPVVGAVVAGPIGVAAGLAVQGLLGRGLNHVASLRYQVTGPWDKPQMKLIEKRSVPNPRGEDDAPDALLQGPAPSSSTAKP